MPEPVVVSPISAHERTLAQIFCDDYAFEIPSYQRPYAWEKGHTSELLSDLLEAMESREQIGGLYFLGCMVLIKQPGSPKADVVDGQQRLTTLTILLAVLRDLTSDAERKVARRLYVYQTADADKGTEARHRLLLRQRDRSFFEKHIQKADATVVLPVLDDFDGSQLRILRNAYYLREQLQSLTEEARNSLFSFLVQRCYLVVVEVPTAVTARRIFTVLNARGMSLTAPDILKADLLERAKRSAERELADRWEATEQDLGREEFVAFFGHIRMIYERDKPRLGLEEGFKKFVTPFGKDPAKFMSDVLEPLAEAWWMLSEPEEIAQKFGREAARAVASLNRIDSTDWMAPALLWLWKRQSATGQFLIDLERLAYFLFLTRADVNQRIARFAGAMDEIDPRPGRQEPQEGIELSASEQNDFIAALSGPLYRTGRVCRPVLLRLDEALSAGGAVYHHNLISIEHVLPQTVEEESEWEELFPDEELREEWMHKIANLVLLTRRINTRASNWDFETKKEKYFRSGDGRCPFPLTQTVLDTPEWTLEYLEERQKELINKLKKVWRIQERHIGIRRRRAD